jgi:hypothetical protein
MWHQGRAATPLKGDVRRHQSIMRLPTVRALLVAACAVSACRPGDRLEKPPEFVYLRTDSVNVSVTVYSDDQAQVDMWLPLRATRTATGTWRRVPYREVEVGTAWLGYVPLEREDDVAASLHWYVEPRDGAVFDAWAPRPVPINQRAVKFSKPGVYRLWATSYAPLDAMSDTLQVRVLP